MTEVMLRKMMSMTKTMVMMSSRSKVTRAPRVIDRKQWMKDEVCGGTLFVMLRRT